MRFFSRATTNKTCSTTITKSDKYFIQRDTSSSSKLLRCVKNTHLQLSKLYLYSTNSNQRFTGRTHSTPSATALTLLSQSLNKSPPPKPAAKSKEINASNLYASSTQLQNMAKKLNHNHISLQNEPLTSSSSTPPDAPQKKLSLWGIKDNIQDQNITG